LAKKAKRFFAREDFEGSRLSTFYRANLFAPSQSPMATFLSESLSINNVSSNIFERIYVDQQRFEQHF
jgi:hypothetical protein